jgi:hypothetical protein
MNQQPSVKKHFSSNFTTNKLDVGVRNLFMNIKAIL